MSGGIKIEIISFRKLMTDHCVVIVNLPVQLPSWSPLPVCLPQGSRTTLLHNHSPTAYSAVVEWYMLLHSRGRLQFLKPLLKYWMWTSLGDLDLKDKYSGVFFSFNEREPLMIQHACKYQCCFSIPRGSSKLDVSERHKGPQLSYLTGPNFNSKFP